MSFQAEGTGEKERGAPPHKGREVGADFDGVDGCSEDSGSIEVVGAVAGKLGGAGGMIRRVDDDASDGLAWELANLMTRG